MAAPEFKAFQTAYIVEPINNPEKHARVTPCHVVTCGRKYITVQMSDETTRKYSLTNIHRENTDEAGLWIITPANTPPNSVLAVNAKTAAKIALRNNEQNNAREKLAGTIRQKIDELTKTDTSTLPIEVLDKLEWRLNELLGIIAAK